MVAFAAFHRDRCLRWLSLLFVVDRRRCGTVEFASVIFHVEDYTMDECGV